MIEMKFPGKIDETVAPSNTEGNKERESEWRWYYYRRFNVAVRSWLCLSRRHLVSFPGELLNIYPSIVLEHGEILTKTVSRRRIVENVRSSGTIDVCPRDEIGGEQRVAFLYLLQMFAACVDDQTRLIGCSKGERNVSVWKVRNIGASRRGK